MPVDRVPRADTSGHCGAAYPDAAPQSTRDGAIDAARGLAIAGVVAGHALIGSEAAGGGGPNMRWAILMLYTTHVASFFVVTGGLSAGWRGLPWPAFWRRLGAWVVWPYLLWSVILITVHFALRDLTNQMPQAFAPWRILWQPPAFMWFLYVLTLGLVLLRLCAPLPDRALMALGGLVIALPYLTDLVPQEARFVGLMCVVAGFGRIFGPWPGGAVPLAVAVMLVTAGFAWSGAQDVLLGYPGATVLYAPAMLAGPVLVLALGRRIVRTGQGRLARCLQSLGRNSLPIYVTHVYVTAGLRILAQNFGVDPGWPVACAATILGVWIPVQLAHLVRDRQLSGVLGWR